MAPEQRDTPLDIDHRVDIYSLGVVFYELLTGELPSERFTPPSARSEADPRIDPIVRQALEKDRDRRQKSAGEVRTQVTSLGSSGQAALAVRKPARTRLVPALIFLLLGIIAPLVVMSSLDRENQRSSAEQLVRITEQQIRLITLNTQLADAQASAGRAASRAGNSALPDESREEAREEQEEFQRRADKVSMDISMANAELADNMSKRARSNGQSRLVILLSMVSFSVVGLVLLVRNGNVRSAWFVGAGLLLVMIGYVWLRTSRELSSMWVAVERGQATRASAPKYSSISENNASAYLAHDDVHLHYALFHAGRMSSSSRGGRNRQSLMWNDESAVTLANGRSFGVTRDSANELFVKINGQEYDLRRGRLFVLNDDGTVIQRNVQPSLKEARSLKELKMLC